MNDLSVVPADQDDGAPNGDRFKSRSEGEDHDATAMSAFLLGDDSQTLSDVIFKETVATMHGFLVKLAEWSNTNALLNANTDALKDSISSLTVSTAKFLRHVEDDGKMTEKDIPECAYIYKSFSDIRMVMQSMGENTDLEFDV